MAESSSSSSFQAISTSNNNNIQPPLYNVFVSFHGEDVRRNFLSHLQAAFKRSGITTFIDKELKRGREISPALLQAIQRSSISVVVFSENYASSSWCLNELLKILERRNMVKQKVMPVFYNVDPSNVRKQTGSYAEAFTRHEKTLEHGKDVIQKWRDALREIANLSGFDSATLEDEYAMIVTITQEILEILERLTSGGDDGLIGIGDRVGRILKSLFPDGSEDDVRILGIWGMGGIGKTTVSRALFHKIKNNFDGYCFLENVRENYGKNGHRLQHLQKKLLSHVTHDKQLMQMDISPKFLQNRLCGLKVLLVLDDIDDMEQLKNLAGGHNWFGVGSKIVITTRNRQLLTAADEVYDYATEQLRDDEALQLFSNHAFNTSCPPKDYLELSSKAIKYACGIPLALKVLGSHLCKKDEKTWESALAKLEIFPDEMVNRILEISFEGLDSSQKNILLDVACFLKGDDVEFATSLWEVCGFHPGWSISVLCDKCLIYFRDNSPQLRMHDLIQEMCKAKVRKESNELGERSRLWEPKDIFHVFNKNTGTSKIECIILNLSETNEFLELREDAFVKMEKLRFLKFFCREINEISTEIRVPRCFTLLPGSLIYLCWDRFPNKFLVAEFDARNLVVLSLRQGCIEQLLKGHWMFRYSSICLKLLQSLDLSGCSEFSNLSAIFANMDHLHELILKGTGVSNLPSSIENLTGLVSLNLYNCKNIASLPDSICNLKRLEHLDVSGCKSLQHLPENIGNLESLYFLFAGGTSIKHTPASIENLTVLVKLHLSNCKNLASLPDSICNLKRLEHLNVSGCKSLQHLPENIGNLQSLRNLLADETSIKHVPDSIICPKHISVLSFCGCRGKKPSTSDWLLPTSSINTTSCMGLQLPPFGGCQKLEALYLSNCNLLEAPRGLHNLSSLSYLDLSGNNFETLPQTIFYNLSSLEYLRLNHCKRLRSLPELPPSLMMLGAAECTSLESFMSSLNLFRGSGKRIQTRLIFSNCFKLKNQCNYILKSMVKEFHLAEKAAQNLYDQGYCCDHGPGLRLGVTLPGSEIPEWFNDQTVGNTLTFALPPDWLDNSLGIAFCLIISPNHTNFESINNFILRLKLRDNDKKAYKNYLHTWLRVHGSFKDDHVVFAIASLGRRHWPNNSWLNNSKHIKCKVRFNILYSDPVRNDSDVFKVKNCAVRLVNVEEKTQPSFNASSQYLHNHITRCCIVTDNPERTVVGCRECKKALKIAAGKKDWSIFYQL